MSYDWLHRGYRPSAVTGGYCDKCERDTPHRNLVCSVCKSTVVGRGENTLKSYFRKKSRQIIKSSKPDEGKLNVYTYYAKLNKDIRRTRSKAFKDSAAKFRAMFEGEKK